MLNINKLKKYKFIEIVVKSLWDGSEGLSTKIRSLFSSYNKLFSLNVDIKTECFSIYTFGNESYQEVILHYSLIIKLFNLGSRRLKYNISTLLL